MVEGPYERRAADPPWGRIAAGFLLPIAGVVLAIVLLARGRGAHGSAVLLASVLGFVVWSLLLSSQ